MPGHIMRNVLVVVPSQEAKNRSASAEEKYPRKNQPEDQQVASEKTERKPQKPEPESNDMRTPEPVSEDMKKPELKLESIKETKPVSEESTTSSSKTAKAEAQPPTKM